MYNITSTIFHKYQLSSLMENNKKIKVSMVNDC